MFSNYSTSLLFIFVFIFSISIKAQDGERLFKSACAACHKTTNNKFIGPGLANVHEKRSIEWFKKFVASSQSFIKSGDAEALKIFEEYNKIIMPDHQFNDAELNAIYEYIKSVSPAKTDVATTEVIEKEIPFKPTEEDILTGGNLFSGVLRFENGGVSCISCHHVSNDNITAGGSLAKDLSDVYDRLGKAGVEAMITGLPFPQMKISFKNNPITEKEAYQITAFLKHVNEERYYQQGTSYQIKLLIWGIIGAIISMGIFPLFWYSRKKDSVNKRIYERQIKSVN